MAKKKYDSSEGVWRTIGGRRVFIRTGQSLSDAMKESGKFKRKDEDTEYKEYDPYKGTKFEKKYDSVEDRYNKDKDFRSMLKKIDDDYNDDKLMSRKEYDKIMRESGMYEKHKGENISYEDYVEATRNVGSVKEVNDSINHPTRKYIEKKFKTNYTADEEDILYRYTEDYGYDGKDSLSNLKGQIDYMRNPRESINETAQRLVEGGDFLIYNEDIKQYLKDRNIKFNEDNFFDVYKKEMVDKIESLYNRGSLKEKYKGTVDYLNQTTNMNGSEILELLKRIDKDKK